MINRFKLMISILKFVLAFIPVVLSGALISVALTVSFFQLNQHVDGYMLAECLVIVLMSVYIFKFRDKFKRNYIILTFLFLLISSTAFFILHKIVIILQVSVFILSVVLNHYGLKRVRVFFQKSSGTLVFLNIFDVVSIFLIIIFWINRNLIYSNYLILYNATKFIFITQGDLFAVLVVLVLILFSIIKAYIAVQIYKTVNKNIIPTDKTLFPSVMKASFINLAIFLTIMRYLISLSVGYSFYFLCCILIGVNFIVFWVVKKRLDLGGVDKYKTKREVILYIFLMSFLILLIEIESDLINLLSWFMSFVILIFVGEINNYPFIDNGLKNKNHTLQPTLRMKQHVWWMQVQSFSALFFFNIISSLSKKVVIENNELKEINVLRQWLESFLYSIIGTNENLGFSIKIIATFILVIVPIISSMLLSNWLFQFLGRHYLNFSKGYFKKDYKSFSRYRSQHRKR